MQMIRWALSIRREVLAMALHYTKQGKDGGEEKDGGGLGQEKGEAY